jgi:ectoine hydroxylase-related dioxygenase (phytanoyl-CoA dioxygenase family)
MVRPSPTSTSLGKRRAVTDDEAMIGPDDRAAYDEDGFVVVRGVVSARVVADLHGATDALEAVAAEFVVDTAVGKVFFEVQSASGRKREAAVFPGALRKITSPSKSQPAFQRLRRHPGIVDVASALGVAGARCVVDQVNLKAPRVGTGFPFHQDASFLHGDAARDLAAFGGVNVVVALDDADDENGGFVVLGGTHRDFLEGQHGYDTSTMNEGLFDASGRCVPALAPGDAVFFHPQLAHGSGPNRSDRRRRLATLWLVGSPAADS